MKERNPDYPYPEKGIREAPDRAELARYIQPAQYEGGIREMQAEAQQFARRFSAGLMQYPRHRELPNWVRAMVEKKVSAEELAQTLEDRLQRAPSEENQEMALLLANEIARMKGGSEALHKHVTQKLLTRLSVKEGEPK